MGESMREMLEFLCRLCARTDKSCVNVFGSDGDKHLIQKKIRLCLPVIVEEQDEMPKQICLSCLSKLESTYSFYTTCIYAQSAIQRLLRNESLHDRDHVNKPGTETKEKDPTSFSLDQYLKRKIDPVDIGKSSKLQRTDNLEKDVTNNNICVETTRASGSEASTSGGNNSEFQFGRTVGGNINGSVVVTNNADFPCAPSTERQKPKLRVKTTSELRQGGQTATVTDCVSALLSLQNSSALSVSVPTTRQSTCVSASHSTSVVFSQSAVPRSSHSASYLPQHVKSSLSQHTKNSSASKGGTSWSPVAQNAKSATSAIQPGKSSAAQQTAVSSVSLPQNATSLLPMPKNTTVSLPVPNSATVSLPVPKNTKASLTMAKSAAVSLTVPQNIRNSSSVPQYSLSVPSSGCTILPKVSQYIIMPNTFASAPTFTVAGTNTVTVLAQALPPNVSLVEDVNVPLGSATALVTPQSTQPPLPVSVQALSVSTTAAVPLASSSLPLVQTVPLQVTKQPSDTVMTSSPTVISQSSTSGSVAYSVLNSNSQALVISSNSHATVTTSTVNMLSKAEAQLSTPSQNLKVSSSSSVVPTGNAAAVRVSTEGKIVGLRSDTVVQAMGNANSTVLSKQNVSAQLRTNGAAVSRTVSHPNILPKPAAPVVTSAKNITSNSSPLLLRNLNYSVPKTKKALLVQPVKTTDTESTGKRKVLIIQGSSSQHSNQSATKTATAPTPVSLSQATVPSAQPVSVRPAQQLKEEAASIIIKKTNCKNDGNIQLPVSGVVLNAKTESQLSDNQTQQKATVLKPQPSRKLPPPPATVPLNSISISENRKIMANTESADLQNGQAGSTSGHQVSRENSERQGTKNVEVPQKSSISNQAPKSRGPVVTPTVSPFTPTLQPAPDPQNKSPVRPSSEGQVEPVTPLSQSPSAAEPRTTSTSSPPAAAAEGKEECPYCHVEFPADILIHHKTLHYREKFYTCIDCDKNFVTEKGLESHRCQKESKG